MAGEYQDYKDANGVTWTIITTKTRIMGSVKDDASPRYFPAAEDQMAVIPSGDDDTATERARKGFTSLRESIDSYATEHKQNVALEVTAKPGGGGAWVLLLLLALALGSDDKRARR